MTILASNFDSAIPMILFIVAGVPLLTLLFLLFMVQWPKVGLVVGVLNLAYAALLLVMSMGSFAIFALVPVFVGILSISLWLCFRQPRIVAPKSRPFMKQFCELTPADFKQHPVWVSAYTLDYNEDWHDDTDEETFRPWLDYMPVGAEELFLVNARFTFADGSVHDGFVTPVIYYAGQESMGIMQPQVFPQKGESHGFWLGMADAPGEVAAFYQAFGKSTAQIFPVHLQAVQGLTTAVAEAEIPGFMHQPVGGKVKVST